MKPINTALLVLTTIALGMDSRLSVIQNDTFNS